MRAARSVTPPVPRWGQGTLVGPPLALLLAAAVITVATGQERVEGDRYTHPGYGIQIDKPARWHFITAATVLALAQRAAGVPAKADPDPVKTAGFAVIISKVPTLGRDFDPQVVVLVQNAPQTPTDLVVACEQLRSGMSEPEAVKPPQRIEVDGKPAVRLDFVGYVDGAPVRASALCAFRDRRAYFVVAQALSSGFDAEAATFDTILQSFHVR
jgi:hypothetical protein